VKQIEKDTRASHEPFTPGMVGLSALSPTGRRDQQNAANALSIFASR